MKENLGNAKRVDVLGHLNQIILTQSKLAEANFDVQEFMNLVVEQVAKLTPATGVVVELVEGEEMVYKAATGTVKNHLGLRLNIKNSLSGLCVQTKKILCSQDTENDARVNREACRVVQARSMVVTPLFHQGEAVGVLKVLSKETNAFGEIDIQTLQLMAGLIGAALAHQIFHDLTVRLLQERTQALAELRVAEEKLKYMAQHDFLTGLPNRRLFMHRLREAMDSAKRRNTFLAVFFLDVDHFKNINDKHGHRLGDMVLHAFASRLLSCLRKSDMAARLGGDEFVILLDEMTEKMVATAIADNILREVKKIYQFKDRQLHVTTSIGIAFYTGQKTSADELIRRADNALYAAKKSGRNTFNLNDDL